jgi:hypothetical protein
MRIAILILSIIGAVICLGLGAYQVACAGCTGSCAAAANEASTAVAAMEDSNVSGIDEPSSTSSNKEMENMASVLGTVAFANLCSGIGLVLQAILGVAGGIVTFSRLGGGQKAKTGAVLLSSAVGITILAHLIGVIMVLNIDESTFPAKNQTAIGFLIILVMGALLHGIATVMAFLAKPNEVLQPNSQSPTDHPSPGV